MVDVSIVSPVHNEEMNLPEFVQRVSKVMRAYGKSWELLLVNDASTDSSLQVIQNLAKKNVHIKGVSHSKRMGQTGCFRTGFGIASGKVIITIDSDLQVFPEDISLFLEKMDSGYDVVNGIRENRQHPFWIKLASRFYNSLMLIFFNSPVFDAASNFTAVKAPLVKNLKLIGNDHRYIIPIVQRRGARKIGEVVVRHQIRKGGKSKYKVLPKYVKGTAELFSAWFRVVTGRYD
jgi:glycosyltransferase involved in cell wall biosynthesis